MVVHLHRASVRGACGEGVCGGWVGRVAAGAGGGWICAAWHRGIATAQGIGLQCRFAAPVVALRIGLGPQLSGDWGDGSWLEFSCVVY